MAIKKVYVSDLTGKEIEGAHKTISINKSERKKYNAIADAIYGYSRARYYTTTVAKVFHLGEDEVNLLPEAIREHLWPTKVKEEEKKPAKSVKKNSS